MAFGFGVLRLSSHDFWSLTPRELAAAMGEGDAAPALNHDELFALIARFPDSPAEDA